MDVRKKEWFTVIRACVVTYFKSASDLLRYHVKQCAQFYNVSAETLAEAVAQTNEFYGGYDIRSTRIVFPNGSIDPWHALGVTQDISPELPAIFIAGRNGIGNVFVLYIKKDPNQGLF